MGKIRTTLVKRTARMLIEKYPDKFTGVFEENKKAVEELLELPSKRFRNLVAGYVTRLYKLKQREIEKQRKEAELLRGKKNAA